MKYSAASDKILKMAEQDQSLRMQWQEKGQDSDWTEKLKEIDEKHTRAMKNIVDDIGWPSISKVGSKASHAAWLLVQHVDQDVDFQKQCLESMKAEADTEVSRRNIAYLTDRIRMNESRPQVYGTQYVKSESDPSLWEPYPVEDIENVDKRRKQMGMQSLQENTDEINQNHPYGTKASSL